MSGAASRRRGAGRVLAEAAEIAYDEPAVEATLLPEPPRPVRVVERPVPLPLPGQLKPLPAPEPAAPRPEPRDPAKRVDQANAAARVEPVADGYINAVQVYPFSAGALYQVYASPGQITDVALQEGESLVGSGPIAAGDTVRWIIGDTESGAGATAASMCSSSRSGRMPSPTSSSTPTVAPTTSSSGRRRPPTWPRSPGTIPRTS